MQESHAFSVRIYSPRWGHDDPYVFRRTSSGWHISNGPHHRETDKRGDGPGVKGGASGIFRNDMIHSPADLPDILEMLWEKLEEGDLLAEDAVREFEALAEWINATTRAVPRGGVVGTYYGFHE